MGVVGVFVAFVLGIFKSLTNFTRLHTLSRAPFSLVSLFHKSCSLILNIATSQEKMTRKSTIISLAPSGQCLYEFILQRSSYLNNTCILSLDKEKKKSNQPCKPSHEI